MRVGAISPFGGSAERISLDDNYIGVLFVTLLKKLNRYLIKRLKYIQGEA